MNPIRQYEIVIEIARHGSISRAAEELHISQPTLSKYLSNLEEQLGIELFNRLTIPIHLTEAGERFVNTGRQIIDLAHQLDKELESCKGNQGSVIKVGISPTRAPYFLPEIISSFRKKNNKTRIVIKERTTKNLKLDLMRGDVDLVISMSSDEMISFEAIELFAESVLLAVPNCCEIEEPLEILKTYPMINTGTGLVISNVLKEILQAVGATEPSIEVQSIETALSLVRAGLGAMIVPTYICQRNELQDVKYMELPTEYFGHLQARLRRSVCIFYRKEQFLTDAEQEFIKVCLEAYGKAYHNH